jgi:hypothetical protein
MYLNFIKFKKNFFKKILLLMLLPLYFSKNGNKEKNELGSQYSHLIFNTIFV